MRAVAAASILAACLFAISVGVTEVWFPALLATAVMLHALARRSSPHSPNEVLLIDAFAIAMALGLTEHTSPGLVAGAAYLIAASVTFAGFGSMILAAVAYPAAVAVRLVMPVPDPGALPSAGRAVVWVAVVVFLGSVAMALIAAAAEVGRSRGANEEALDAERRASEMKNEFVSMITHELRTPLTNIAGFADTLNDTWHDLPASDVNEFLRIIVSESDHLKNLVEDVLAIPRLKAGRLLLDSTDFPLRPAAFKVVDLLFPDGGHRSASVSVGSDVIVHADPNRVEQVLRNLIENARKYGGDSISVEAIPLGDLWQVVVADNGTGLSDEDQEKIFEAFEQVSSGDARTDTGFGLGLSVARHLVDAMGGRIWYEPGFPVGARFCFTLPTVQEQLAADTSAEVA